MNHPQFLCLVHNDQNDLNAPEQALDFALAAAAFGHQVKLVFAGPGVAQLQHAALESPNWAKYLPQLDLYDLAPVWVCENSLSEFSATLSKIPVSQISPSATLTAKFKCTFPKSWPIQLVPAHEIAAALNPPTVVKFF